MTPDLASVTLTELQIEQLQSFLQEHEHIGSVVLRPLPISAADKVEVVLLGRAGEETAAKRILFRLGTLSSAASRPKR